jgi:hypothetical protein
VRSDAALYLKYGATGIDDVTLSYYSKLAPDVYARASGGYLETMFGGAGGEVLYRPFGSRWAVGVDMWQVYQRNFDDLFGFQKYNMTTGHVSLYWETPWYNITTVLRGGRYLAGDYGATFEIYRRFDTGILIGGWFTLTNVPFSEFGEGSFDKGIRIVIPMEWVLPIRYVDDRRIGFETRSARRRTGTQQRRHAVRYDAVLERGRPATAMAERVQMMRRVRTFIVVVALASGCFGVRRSRGRFRSW